jgi:hypothetical protein
VFNDSWILAISLNILRFIDWTSHVTAHRTQESCAVSGKLSPYDALRFQVTVPKIDLMLSFRSGTRQLPSIVPCVSHGVFRRHETLKENLFLNDIAVSNIIHFTVAVFKHWQGFTAILFFSRKKVISTFRCRTWLQCSFALALVFKYTSRNSHNRAVKRMTCKTCTFFFAS